jgi:hypothetical protein
MGPYRTPGRPRALNVFALWLEVGTQGRALKGDEVRNFVNNALAEACGTDMVARAELVGNLKEPPDDEMVDYDPDALAELLSLPTEFVDSAMGVDGAKWMTLARAMLERISDDNWAEHCAAIIAPLIRELSRRM